AAARREAALCERRVRACVEQRRRARLMIEARVARAAAARRGIRIGAWQVTVAIRDGVVAIVLPRQRADVRIELLDSIRRRALLREIDRQTRDVARARDRIPPRAVANRHERERQALR